MKFVKKIPPTDYKLSAELVADGWRKIKEPKNLLTTILASIPFMIINGILAIFVTIQFYNPIENILFNHSFLVTINISDLIYFFIASFILIIVHELIHMIFIPNFIKSDKVFWGITLNGGFVTITEKISKIRFIIISIMPLIVLSIVFPIILGVFNVLNGFIMLLIIVNAMASSVDVLNLFLVLFQAPRNSFIQNNGFETYVK
jgi:hypothetical protein